MVNTLSFTTYSKQSLVGIFRVLYNQIAHQTLITSSFIYQIRIFFGDASRENDILFYFYFTAVPKKSYCLFLP